MQPWVICVPRGWSTPLEVEVGDLDLPPIWEEVACAKGCMKGIDTLNHTLLRGIPSFRTVFEWRAHFRASLPLLVFVKNASILNPSLYLACTEGGGSRLG